MFGLFGQSAWWQVNKIICADALDGLKSLADESVDMCVTSPPYYGLRDYGNEKQIGMEECPQEYVRNLTEIFMEVYRVLKPMQVAEKVQ